MPGRGVLCVSSNSVGCGWLATLETRSRACLCASGAWTSSSPRRESWRSRFTLSYNPPALPTSTPPFEALEELWLHVLEARTSESDWLLDLNHKRLQHHLDTFLGPRSTQEGPALHPSLDRQRHGAALRWRTTLPENLYRKHPDNIPVRPMQRCRAESFMDASMTFSQGNRR